MEYLSTTIITMIAGSTWHGSDFFLFRLFDSFFDKKQLNNDKQQ